MNLNCLSLRFLDNRNTFPCGIQNFDFILEEVYVKHTAMGITHPRILAIGRFTLILEEKTHSCVRVEHRAMGNTEMHTSSMETTP